MPPFDASVQVLEEFDGLVSGQWLRRVAEHALAVGSPGTEAEVSVVIAGDDVVRDLNRRHRGLDENTDVLAFAFGHRGEYHGVREQRPAPGEETDSAPAPDDEFVVPPGEGRSLGEVVISYPQAERQAAQSGHPVRWELAVLVTHGVLHLLGHDHAGPEEEAAMRRMEAEVLAGL